jgi:hypothetical protein
MIHSPIGMIRFDSSAMGMNFDGLIGSPLPRCHLMRASKPETRSLATSTIGW